MIHQSLSRQLVVARRGGGSSLFLQKADLWARVSTVGELSSRVGLKRP